MWWVGVPQVWRGCFSVSFLSVAREADGGLQAALIALSPRTGEILAMVGGESFQSKNQLNRTVQMRRQTGSS